MAKSSKWEALRLSLESLANVARFFAQLALIFIMHPESFANDNTKITYAINNMGGSAFKYFQPYLNDLGNNNIPLPSITVWRTLKSSSRQLQ